MSPVKDRLETNEQTTTTSGAASETTTPDGPGLEKTRRLLARGRPDPADVGTILATHRGERDGIFALLHSTVGNGYVQQVLAPKSDDQLPYRAQMETAFGQDFSNVRVKTGQARAMGQINARAAAQGEQVAFGDSTPSPQIVAHELAHVVQHRRHGGMGVQKKPMIASADNAAEREADMVGERVARGEAAGDITAQPEGAIHRFAPGGHREATIDGLKESYAAQEIGEIYASNWERDFSQGHPAIASATIAWTAVKNYATTHDGDPGPAAAPFRAAIEKVVNISIFGATAESMGNYQYWEHLDQPPPALVKSADERWAGKANGLAGYLLDARASVKDQMSAAVDAYRKSKQLAATGPVDNWAGADKPEGYSTLPAKYDDPKVAPRDPIRVQASKEAAAEGAKVEPAHDAAAWSIVGQHLGRAMHVLEDFWAHSNWLELAKAMKASGAAATGPAANAKLKTGTFDMPAKAHALGHKLLALSSNFMKDFQLLLKVYGRTAASDKLDSPEAKARKNNDNGAPDTSDHDLAYGDLRADSMTNLGEISDVGNAVSQMRMLKSAGYKLEDFLCNQNWLEAMHHKGQLLIAQGEANSGPDSHGTIAKDQPEGDGHKDHGGAHALASAANMMVFGPLRAIMDEADPAVALAKIQTQLALVDSLLVAPSPSHPLWHLVSTREGDR